jgi:hypothetical protein
LGIRRIFGEVYHIGGSKTFRFFRLSLVFIITYSSLWVRHIWDCMDNIVHCRRNTEAGKKGRGGFLTIFHIVQTCTDYFAISILQSSVATVTVTYLILVLLVSMVVFAHPHVRSTAHDSFEATHRFLGWTAAALVWAQVSLYSHTSAHLF